MSSTTIHRCPTGNVRPVTKAKPIPLTPDEVAEGQRLGEAYAEHEARAVALAAELDALRKLGPGLERARQEWVAAMAAKYAGSGYTRLPSLLARLTQMHRVSAHRIIAGGGQDGDSS